MPIVDENFDTTRTSKVALSADHEVRLERLEHQLAHILYKPSREKVCDYGSFSYGNVPKKFC
jgi:hypothetical protein